MTVWLLAEGYVYMSVMHSPVSSMGRAKGIVNVHISKLGQ